MFEHKYLSKIYLPLKRVVAILFTRDVATFLFFLLLAFLFWIMHGTSAMRDVKMKVPIAYVGIPSNVELIDSLPSEVNIVIKDKGSVLLPFMFKTLQPLQVDLSKSFNETGRLDVSLKSSLQQLMTQFPTSTTLYNVDFSHITAEYTFLHHKLVPVGFQNPYEPSMPYILKDSIRFIPSKVTIYGAPQYIDTIHQVFLHPLSQNINKSGIYKQKCLKIKHVKIVPSDVNVKLSLEMSTEKSLSVPVHSVGCPPSIALRTFPDQVKVSFNIGVSRFQSVNVADFRVVIYYDSIQNDESKQAFVYFEKAPKGLLQLRTQPTQVEYILEQNTK